MGIRHDIAQFVNSFLASGSTRAKLFALELAEEKQRWAKVLVLAIFALLFALLGLIMASVAVTLFFWDTEYRWWALFGVMAFHFVAALICYAMLKSSSYSESPPFASTRETLCADWQQFTRSTGPTDAEFSSHSASSHSALVPVEEQAREIIVVKDPRADSDSLGGPR